MAVYNIFASADATLYSNYPAKKTGRDPILEVSVNNSQDGLRFLYRNALTDNPYYTYDLAATSEFTTESIKRAVLQF
jgi:hypothetical protein